MDTLVIDVGVTHVKIFASGEKDKREIEPGPEMMARQMVSSVKRLADDWKCDRVSIDYPGPGRSAARSVPRLQARTRRCAGLAGGDLRRAATGDQLLALAGRAVFHPCREVPAGDLHRGRRAPASIAADTSSWHLDAQLSAVSYQP